MFLGIPLNLCLHTHHRTVRRGMDVRRRAWAETHQTVVGLPAVLGELGQPSANLLACELDVCPLAQDIAACLVCVPLVCLPLARWSSLRFNLY